MKALIKKVETVEIEVNEVNLGVFSKESEWNGMICYSGQAGQVIVASSSGASSVEFLDGIFSDIFGQKEESLNIVAASPDLMVLMCEGKNGHTNNTK